MDLKSVVEKYFRERTPEGEGILKYITDQGALADPATYVNDNDYLRLSKRLTEYQSLNSESGNGSTMSPIYLKAESLQARVENQFKDWLGYDDVAISQSGYCANVGLMQALIKKGTPVYMDRYTHASFIDGIYSRFGKLIIFKHNDMVHLEKLVSQHGAGIIVVDSLYSGYGTFAPLRELVSIKEKHGCILVVDESHSLGLYGEKGVGLVNRAGLREKVDFITASLSKTCSTRAGLIAGHAPTVLYVKENSFPYIFSSSLADWDLNRVSKAIEIIQDSDEARKRVMSASALIRKEFHKLSLNVPITTEDSPIICIIGGTEANTKKIDEIALKGGVLGAYFCAPATPKKASMLRLTLHSELTQDDIERILTFGKTIAHQAKL